MIWIQNEELINGAINEFEVLSGADDSTVVGCIGWTLSDNTQAQVTLDDLQEVRCQAGLRRLQLQKDYLEIKAVNQ